MSVKIGSNIASLVSQRRLGEATDSLSRVYERLSSGQRINRASDDAAGLAIADSLNAKSKIYTQAIRNGNDGISLLNIADSAVSALSDVVIRIRELSEQAANGSYSSKQREAIDAEAQQLSKEFTRITRTTSFNGVKIFDGSLGNGLQLQLGEGSEGTLKASVGGAVGTGQFNTSIAYSSAGSKLMTTLADVNNDGNLDIVGSGGSNRIEILLGSGNGNFQSAIVITTTISSNWSVHMKDLDQDGILDMVSSGDANAIQVRMGLGNGNFGAATTYTTLNAINYSTAVEDINNDGVLDIVSSGNGNRIEVRLGLGDGRFGNATGYTTFSSIAFKANLGDLNGDGILDLVTSGNSNSTEVRLGLGDGSFGAATNYTFGGAISFSAKLADLNGDGKLDLASAGSGGMEIRLGRGGWYLCGCYKLFIRCYSRYRCIRS